MSRPGAWWGATIGAVLAYTAAVLAPFPPALYFSPGSGSWGFLDPGGEPSIRWFGWLIYAAAGGLVGVVVGRFIRRRPPWALVWLIAVASLVVLAWHERSWFLR